ncbi:MAG: hypothetical protein ACXWJX_15820 [Limisphaerales bacterium]
MSASKFNSVIGLHVEPALVAGESPSFEVILLHVAICLAQKGLMTLRANDSESTNRLQSQGLLQGESETDSEWLEKTTESGAPASESFKEFCCYSPGGNAGRFFVTDLQPAVEAIKQKLSALGALDRAEIAVMDMTGVATGSEFVAVLRSRFQTVYPASFPLPFSRHIPQ